MAEKKNRFESWRRKMVTLKKIDGLLVFWMLNQIEGVNKTDARIVSKVEDAFDLISKPSMELPPEEYNNDIDIEVSELELGWIRDKLESFFKQSKVPTRLGRFAIEFDDRMKEIIEEKSE